MTDDNDFFGHDDSLRMKTYGVIFEEFITKNGRIEASLGLLGMNDLASVTIDDLNKIEFEFEIIENPVFTPSIIKNKVINYGFVRFRVKSIKYPADITPQLRQQINSFFFSDNSPKITAIAIDGVVDVCGIRETDEIQEFSEAVGIAVCFTVKSLICVDGKADKFFADTVLLNVKAAVKVRIVVSRFKLSNTVVSDITNPYAFECGDD